MASEAGKGSARRMAQVPQAEIDANWERIFGKKKDNSERGLAGASVSMDESGFIENPLGAI